MKLRFRNLVKRIRTSVTVVRPMFKKVKPFKIVVEEDRTEFDQTYSHRAHLLD